MAIEPVSSCPGAGFGDGGVLDQCAPGVPLAGRADAVTRGGGLAGLDDDELMGVLRAWRRLESWCTAGLLAAVAELARRRPAGQSAPAGPGEFPAQLSEFISDEVAAALTLTGRTAGGYLELALDLAIRLPGTARALRGGVIDCQRARIICDLTRVLADAQAREVEARVLPDAGQQTSGQLRAAVARAVLAADPGAAARRREQAQKDPRVCRWQEDAGTAALAGFGLPPDEVLEADQRITARALALRAAGLAGSLGQLRARAYLDTLLGQDSTPTTPAPPAAAVTSAAPPVSPAGPAASAAPPVSPAAPAAPPVPASPPSPASSMAPPSPVISAGSASPADPADSSRPTGPAGPLPPADQASPRSPARSPGPPLPAGPPPPAGPAGSGPAIPAIGAGLAAPAQPGPGSARQRGLAARLNLTIPLTTLLGLADEPGHVAGFGPVDPGLARQLATTATAHPATRCCLTITTDNGTAIGHGCAPGPGVLERLSTQGFTLTIDPLARGTCDHRHQEPRYTPSRRLQHLVNARTPTCSAPGCQQPAARCDLDHTTPYDQGGRTCECDLAPLCRHHHRCKQSEGWHLEQPHPGVMTWTTPAGRHYITVPDAYPT